MSTFAEAAAALRTAAAELPEAVERAVTEATALVTAAVIVEQSHAGAGSGRLRGVGKQGAQIGVKGTVLRGTGLVRATGPAHLLDHPTKAHTITARAGASLSTPYGPRRSVRHPGTTGTYYFEHALEATSPKVVAIIERNVADSLLKAL